MPFRVIGMTSKPVAKALRESFEAMMRGDIEPMHKLTWPDAVMHFPGQTPLSGEVRGWDEIVHWAQKLFERVGKTYGEEVIDVVADDDWAFLMTNYHAERHGHKLQDRSINVCRLRDGRIAETWVLVGDNKVFEAVFG